MTHGARRLLLAVLVVATVGASWGAEAGAGDRAAVRAPRVSGPVTAGQRVSLIGTDASSEGYVQEEYFIEGEASAYEAIGKLRAEGRWRVAESETAPYKTRLVVWRPADLADFNGSVFVEWLNVSAGFDNAVDWLMAHNQIIREGAAWVGVSAQAVGVEGGEDLDVPFALDPLKQADPERYGTLSHPGDAFSYDIFTQAGVAVRGDADGVEPVAGYDVRRIISVGESQSAMRMATYVNAIHPLVEVYDGFLIHSRGGQSAPLGDQTLGEDDPAIPNDVRIRTDVATPVLTFETESDLVLLGFIPARQRDSKFFRLWEVAGTSHVDAYTAGAALTDLGDGSAEAAQLDPAKASGGPLGCTEPVNAGAQHAVLAAALGHLDRWVRGGAPPSKAGRIRTRGNDAAASIVRDEHGIARGGVRTPIVDVPIAANDGEENRSGGTCRLFGRTAPFDSATLAALYPNGSKQYAEQFAQATDETVKAGFWLEPEAENFKTAARQIIFE